MASPALSGPYPLTNAGVDRNVTRKAPGVYALGETRNNTFYISYVGRSDDDVAGRLKQHIGKYPEFKFAYATSPKDAFEKECELYHDYGGQNNPNHPARPAGSGWKCPRCKIFDRQ
jgi:hypothetical protein